MKRSTELIIPSLEEDAAITAAALKDPDNPPLTHADFERMPRVDGQHFGVHGLFRNSTNKIQVGDRSKQEQQPE